MNKYGALTQEQIDALNKWVNDMQDIAYSRGQHKGHTLKQYGRCVYRSCGERYQDHIPSDRK